MNRILPSWTESRAREEAIRWCALHCSATKFEQSPEVQGGLRLLHRADEVMASIHGKKHEDISKTTEWRVATNLIAKANPDGRSPLRNVLRSPLLDPGISIGEYMPEEEIERAVAHVISRRSAALEVLEREGRAVATPHAKGRFLIYEPAENVCDGYSQYISLGFFDANDAPPWDTWVEYSGKTLLSWVPEELIDMVQRGIDGNITQCIQWLDRKPRSFWSFFGH